MVKMVNINFPTDSQGTQSLQKKNKAKTVAHVDAVTPDPESQKDSKNQKRNPPHNNPTNNKAENKSLSVTEQTTSNKSPQLSRGSDRRKENRRQQKINVILNTRSEQDRRTNSAQRKEDLSGSDTIFGIDTKA